jgi:hypothetical protein
LRSPFANPPTAKAFGSLCVRLFFALMGAFTGATLCWIGWGIMTADDYVARGRFIVDATVVALGIGGACVAFNARSRSARIATTGAAIASATFWLAFPDSWLVRSPTPSDASATPTAQELREAEREMRVTFPASTRILVWNARQGSDPYLQVKFEIATAEWPLFLATSPFHDQPPQEDAGVYLGVDHEGWTPNRVEHLLKGEVRLPALLDLNLGADRNRSDVVVVYLIWHKT